MAWCLVAGVTLNFTFSHHFINLQQIFKMYAYSNSILHLISIGCLTADTTATRIPSRQFRKYHYKNWDSNPVLTQYKSTTLPCSSYISCFAFFIFKGVTTQVSILAILILSEVHLYTFWRAGRHLTGAQGCRVSHIPKFAIHNHKSNVRSILHFSIIWT